MIGRPVERRIWSRYLLPFAFPTCSRHFFAKKEFMGSMHCAPVLALLAGLFLIPAVGWAETTPIAHYHLKSDEGAVRDTAAPAELQSFAEGGPTLKASGAPKVMSHAPAIRSSAYTGSIKFEDANQCYAAPVHLARGENWVVEVWAYATHADDKGLHTVLANGDGGNGFLIAQSGAHWQLFVGGVGGSNLGQVKANTWTHLAIVRDRGITSAWIDGKKVANQLPAGGGGANNFSLGASAPGKEAFQGWISEARVSTFKPGQFAGATDFLVDTAQAKVLRDAERALVAKLIVALATSPGVQQVEAFDEHAYDKDWLVSAAKTPASVQVIPGKDNQTAQIMLTNGLVSRTFLVADGNLGCISLRRADKDIEFVRAIKPEARVCLNGHWVDIGGLVGALDQAFITPDWYYRLQSSGKSFRLVGLKVGPCVKPYEWKPKCNAPQDIPWPALGHRVTFEFAPPEDNAALDGLRIDLHYEIYDGIPVMMKTFALRNRTSKEFVVTRFEGEHLAVQPTNSKMMHVESDYSFALANFRDTSSGLGIHAGGGRAKFKDYYLGGGTTRFLRDPNWGSMATLNPAEDIFLDDIENTLLISTPPTGPNWTVKPGETFDAFRTFTILNDTTEDERRFLAQRRFYKTLAPQSNEHLFEVHAPSSHHIKHLGPLLDQMHEVGFEQLQAPEHPGSFNYADASPGNIAAMKTVCDYAKKYDIRVGAYQLMMASQGWGSRQDNFNCIDPVSKNPGSAFGQSACGASAWADMYYSNMWKVIDGAGMRAFKPDGPYHGDCCAATDHPHHQGLEDSQWAQWKWMCKILHEGQKRDLYLTIPDWYVLNGQTCTGMGYREATDNIDIGLQTLIYRQYIFDGTWHKTASMGWVNLNTEMLHGDMEQDLDRYERMFFTTMSSGAQVWVRGHRLYDGPKSKAMLIKWMTWYKKYRDLVQGDIIHLRRPDGRGLDYTLHVDPKNKRGLLLVFNPLKEPVTKTLTVPLYYTGLAGQARIREQESEAKSHPLDDQSQVKLQVTIPADGFSWYVIE
jgi:hypothetical protein